MKLHDALELVIELAERQLPQAYPDHAEQKRQLEAIEQVRALLITKKGE